MPSRREGFLGTDRFQVEKLLGEGGFGSVYQVFDRQRGEHVALKTLDRLDGDALYRFKKEFRALADVSHPSLVSFFELFSDGDMWFFTMELVRGADFYSYVVGDHGVSAGGSGDELKKTVAADEHEECSLSLDERRLRWSLSELAGAVQALHVMGMLHRDIKPDNVLVTEEGRVVLLDFGLVTHTESNRSNAGGVVGTVAYMPPEQGMGKELTEAADWYAVGVMLYEALTGQLPYDGNPVNVVVRKQRADPPAPGDVEKGTSADLSDLALRLLARNPKVRANGEDIRQTLGAVEPPIETSGVGGVKEEVSSGSVSGSLLPPIPSFHADEVSTSRAHGRERRPFIGRDEELRALVEALTSVRRGCPVVVEVHGRSGMGKSALLATFMSTLSRGGETVLLSGQCYEQESVPYKAVDAVIDALCRYLMSLDDMSAALLMPRDVRALVRLFPVLERVKAVRKAPRDVLQVPDLLELRQRGFSALGELLGTVADRKPLVMVIDDLQWGDADSALLLSKLLTQADPPAMLLVLSYRSEERDQSPFLREMLDGTALRSFSRQVEVGCLSDSHAHEMALSLIGEEASQSEAQAIVKESAGSPFFIQLLSRYSGSLGRGETLESVLSSLARDLPDKVKRLLETVALSGRPISSTVAIRAADLEGEGWKTVDALRTGHFLRFLGGKGAQLECYHDRVREAIITELDEERLRACHSAMVRALNESNVQDMERLAVHLEGAGEYDEAAQAIEIAANQAAEKLAFERAARFYERALKLGFHDEADERSLRLKLAEALANAGFGAEAAPQFLIVARGLPRLESLELRRRAAFHFLSMGRFGEGYEILEEVLNDLGMKLARTTRRAILSIVARKTRLWLRGLDFQECPEEEIDPELLLRIDVCWAVSAGFRFTEATFALDYGMRYLHMALDAGEPHRIATAYTMEALIDSALLRKRDRQVAEALGKARALAERLGDFKALAFEQLTSGMVAWSKARWREALERSELAASIFLEKCTGVSFELAQANAVIVWSLFYCGEIREIVRRVPTLTLGSWSRGDIFASICYVGGYGFLAWLASDDVDSTRRELTRVREAWPEEGFQLQHYLLALGDVLVDLYCGEGASALKRTTEIWPLFERSLFLKVAAQRAKWFHLRAAGALLSALAQPKGSTERASLLREANRFTRGLGKIDFPTAKPLAHALEAGVCVERGETELASSHLERSERDFTALEMSMHEAVVRRCRAALASGDEARSLLDSSGEYFEAQGVARPECVVRMIAPGFDEL